MTVAGENLLGVFEERQRSFVARSRPNGAVQPRHGFGVVIEHVGLRIEHDSQRLFQTLKIGDEDFDATIRRQFANLADGFGKNTGTADIVIVAVHARHDGVFQSESGDSLGDALGLIPIDRLADGPWARRKIRSAGCRCRPAA